jgi:hypothetical protein
MSYIISQGIKTKNDNYFINNYKKHSIYSTEFKQKKISKVFDYSQDININIENNGDLLHRCFIQIEVPILNFTDSIINNNDYNIFKTNKLNNIQIDIDYWTEEYENFYNYGNIQIIVYNNILPLLNLNNLTLDLLKSKLNIIINDYSNNMAEYKLLVDTNLFDQIDIIEYIINLTTIKSIINLKTTITKMYKNIVNNLQYYYSNKIYQQNKYNKVKEGKLFFKWINNLGHNYINNFELNIDGIIYDNYSNNYINIYNPCININNKSNYNKLIGANSEIYQQKENANYIYIPLLFWFCQDISKSLPLIGLHNSKLQINCSINNIHNLLYFQDWEQYYNDILTIEILRKDHNINDDNNTIIPYDLDYNKVELILPENIYKYYCKRIDKKVLDVKFKNINSDSILNNYGSEDINGKYLSFDDFIYLMNNLKIDTLLPKNTKILIGNYHYFIDYNYLYNLVPKPNIFFIGEYCYIDDVEKQELATKTQEYLVEVHNEIELDINNNSLYDTLNEFNGLVKEIYYFSQTKLNLNGISQYGQSQLNNYINNYIDSIKFKLGNEYDIFEHDYLEPYYLLSSELPNGVKYTTFSLEPSNILQPSGTLNMTSIKGRNIEIIIKDNYKDYYYSKNNSNNLGSLFTIIYTKYNKFVVEKGKGKLIFY